MTTIAWDGETLACDSRITDNVCIIDDAYNKLFETELEYNSDIITAYALSGSISDFQIMHHIIETNTFHPIQETKHQCSGIFVGVKRVYTLEPHKCVLIPYKRNTLLGEGSGGIFALSALKLGLNAVQAVKHAITLDYCSGGKVKHLSLPSKNKKK